MPGAGKQSVEIQAQIKELLEAGFDPTTIHRRLKVGRSSIYRMKRCLQQHGTAYMPVELNKKNGRPKVLSREQELEVRDWLRDPQNRNRYLDDLVWLIHDRFGIVCSTTTMSKMKRKWLRVIECEESGQPLDDATRMLIMETHPHLPILQQQQAVAPQAQMLQSAARPNVSLGAQMMQTQQPETERSLAEHVDQQQQQPEVNEPYFPQPDEPSKIDGYPPLQSSTSQVTDPQLQVLAPQIDPQFTHSHYPPPPQHHQHMETHLQQQLQREIAGSTDPPQA